MTEHAARITATTLGRIAADAIGEGERSHGLEAGTGVAIAVVHAGEIAYQGTFGLRDRARGLPVTPETSFDIGSLTKSMSVAALLKAHDERRLDVDEPLRVRNALALGHPALEEVTLADILAHRTGLPGHDLLWYCGGYAPRELAARVRYLDVVPNGFRNVFIYNNLLYGCTRLTIEDVFEKSWEEHMREEILAPLGMNATSFGAGNDSEAAVPYAGRNPIARKDMSCAAPAGGGRSTLEDMTRWALFELRASGTSMRTMHEPKISAAEMNPLLLAGLEWLGSPAYGYGWLVGEAHGRTAVFHMGLIDGFSSLVVLFPALSLGFVVLVNANLSSFPGRLVEALFAHIEDHRPKATAPSTGEPAASPGEVAKTLAPPPSGIEGHYEHPAYGAIEVVRSGDELRASYRGNHWPLRFHSAREGVLVVNAFGLELAIPATCDDGRIAIPLSLDPRVPPQVFARARGAQT